MVRIAFIASSLATLIIAAGVSPVAAWWRMGNQLQDECQRPAPAFAMGYIFGLLDGLELGEQFGAKRRVCLPDGVTGGQLKDVVCRYVDANPDQRRVPASYLAETALEEAWPCH